LSYTLKNPVLFETENNIAGQTDYFGVVYLEEYDESQPIQIDHESAEAVWTTIDKALLEPHMAPYRREGLKRLKIHMEGIWGKEEISEVRKLANVILYRKSDKKILLQRRSEKSKKFPGYLGPFGGHLEVGEDFVAGLKRELEEELNYKIQKPVFLEEWSNELGGTKYIGQTFIEEFDDTQEIQVNDESEQAEWVSLEEALAETRMLGHRKETLLKLKPVLEKVWGETRFIR
jgi:8-oxo-dGTP pyrophosphatase MutT (NUDIX family)